MAGVQQLLLVLVLLVQVLLIQVLCVVCVFVLCVCEFGLNVLCRKRKEAHKKRITSTSLLGPFGFVGNFTASQSDQHHTHTHL